MRGDPQATRVYAWEWACQQVNDTPWNADSCRKLIKQACKLYGVRPPSIYICEGKSGRRSYYSPMRHHITLIYAHRTPFVCLHEAAHAIQQCYYGNTVETHGKEWLGIYCWLLQKSKLASRGAIRDSLKVLQLKAMPPAHATPRALKRKRKKKAPH